MWYVVGMRESLLLCVSIAKCACDLQRTRKRREREREKVREKRSGRKSNFEGGKTSNFGLCLILLFYWFDFFSIYTLFLTYLYYFRIIQVQ